MFTEEDNKIIYSYLDKLMDSCDKHFLRKEADRAMILDAFEFANKAHANVRRRSGEPYIIHPIAVANIVVTEIGLGTKSVCAALLHDVVEDTDYTVDDIKSRYGEKVSSMVDGLTKIKKAGDLAQTNSQQAENFKKMLFTLSDDVRVILIKLSDRLHNMRTLQSMPPKKRTKIVSETITLFAPLAHRLGLYTIKTELEDYCLKYSYPEEYDMICKKLSMTTLSRNEFVDKFNAPIIKSLESNGIDFQICGREKAIYSIWKKMQRKKITLEEVYDLFAIRIVFKPAKLIPESSQCWHIYSLITEVYKPKPDRIRDWISIPKANGYESLHCTVMGPDGIWVEVQIRSERMNEIAERGFAAHWKYKQNEPRENELDKWLKEVRSALSGSNEHAVEFLDEFKLNLYSREIVVFTPKGDSRILPKGAIYLDFAYDIHTNIGNKAIGVKVDHKIQSLFSLIRSGDQIEIITSESSSPSVEWIDKVHTSKAKQAVRAYLKNKNSNNVNVGKEKLIGKLKQLNISSKRKDVMSKILGFYSCATKEEFYSNIGSGIINIDNLGNLFDENNNHIMPPRRFWSFSLNPLKIFTDNKKRQSLKKETFIIAKCCNPIPGDEVVGFRTDSGKIIMHKKGCEVATDIASKQGDRIVDAEWTSKTIMSYLVHLQIEGIDRRGIILNITQVISGQLNINIDKLVVETKKGLIRGYISMYVSNIHDIQETISLLKKIKGVSKVSRLEGKNDYNPLEKQK
ncbi:MAG: bifunctional (p)ppGpp synthetase/guanosine-3',5'-bis(diphosphate) 3'-pyrophosphohydrolase [Bacteroidetes bacterium]|nr:bifunctional (p)ppGpp synthetase/guanosine-3',5'-bis(diphosphate) 3'-pyrophosphohydrolase [Bacteroidota bacterium]